MRSTRWQFRIGVLLAMIVLFCESRGGGIGISTPPESPDTSLVSPCPLGPYHALFFQRRPGILGDIKFRDLEFQWDSLYSGARGYIGLSATDRGLLDSLGTS